ncbi:aminotransferase class V-fold PLP-dependent enzyme [Sphaerisporangium album]|uniref:Aminotransferase class V-fold PLP-dependent enzyme n=1 Tax=Sphaerisporangium album TaxID=509200 RepID=A0A367FI97_9ACTN|nr:aminotransferase class I/II-fold pyridoxal phosphate-dependent enzyme [Sphaerisporangium album]RCG30103.1 aminotransferase class V-fold PLP-dependent enzyme [Sphaerisporangium album]
MIETFYSKSFASDNHAGAHPSVIAAAGAANDGDAVPYGGDPWTDALDVRIRAEFGDAATNLVVLNGTGANMVGLSLMLGRRYEAVICPETAHIAGHEGGASERVLGVKLLTVPTPDGKLTPGDVTARLADPEDFNAVQPKVVSISQVTEIGTCYTLEEVTALAETVHANGMLLHMDGARLANAAAYLGCSLRALTTDAGVDVLSFGASKNGAMIGEAVVVLRPELAEGGSILRRQTLQLASKMRFVSAQISALLTDELWRRNAAHANAMARRLADAVEDLPGLTIRWPVQSNAVFASIPAEAAAVLQARFRFHVMDGAARWMTAFDTTPEDVDTFATAIRQALKG